MASLVDAFDEPLAHPGVMPIMRDTKVAVSNLTQIGDGPIEEWVAVAGGGFQRRTCDLPALLQDADLLYLYEDLIAEDLAVLFQQYDTLGRESFLNVFLKDFLGIVKLTDRQFLANALARAMRNGTFGAPRSA